MIMKRTFLHLLFMLSLLARAQDPSLPQGSCDVLLASGKTLKAVKLWGLHTDRLEYAKNGSLHDLALSEINYLKIDGELWRYGDSARLLKLMPDAAPPQGSCDVYLTSGRTLKDVKLFRLHADRLEYTKNGSLHTLPFSHIDYLDMSGELWRCGDSAMLFKLQYDWILPYNRDTIFCLIRKIKPRTLVYQLPGSGVYHNIELCHVIKYSKPGAINGVRHTFNSQRNASAPAPMTTRGEADTTDYFSLGKSDAMHEFRGNGSFTGGFVFGMIPIVGWLSSAVSLAITPKASPQKRQLYTYNAQYRKGYRKGLRHKKAIKTVAGTITGALSLAALIVFI